MVRVEVGLRLGTALDVAVQVTLLPSVDVGVAVSVVETLREAFTVAVQEHEGVWVRDGVAVGLCEGGL